MDRLHSMCNYVVLSVCNMVTQNDPHPCLLRARNSEKSSSPTGLVAGLNKWMLKRLIYARTQVEESETLRRRELLGTV